MALLSDDDLKALRADGLTDTQILTSLRKHAPDLAGDIDGLRQDGLGDDKILSGVLKHYSGDQPKAEKDTSFSGALQHGLAAQVSGYGKTARAAGASDVGKLVERGGSAIDPSNYETASDKVGLSPGTWGYIPRAVAEAAPGLATDLMAGAAGGAVGSLFGPIGTGLGGLGGFAASFGARNFGSNVQDRVKRDDPTKEIEDATTKDKLIAGASTAGEAALNRIGLKGIPVPGGGKVFSAIEGVAPNVAKGLSGGAVDAVTAGAGAQALKQLPGQIAGAGIREGAAGAAGNVVNQVGRTIGTEKGLEIDPTEAANAAVLSGATAAGLRGLRGVPDAVQSAKMAPFMDNAEAHTRLVDRLGQTGENLQKSDGMGEAIRTAQSDMRVEYKAARKPMKDFLQNDPHAGVMVDKAYSQVSKAGKGRPLEQSDLAALRDRLSGSPEGDALVRAIEDLNALNQLKKLGNFKGGDNPALTAGAADTGFVKAIQPSNAKSMLGFGGLSAAAHLAPAAALAAIPGASAMAPLAAGAIAVPFAVKGGAKALDAITGNGNPGGQYVRRFADFAPPPPAGGAPAGGSLARGAGPAPQTPAPAQPGPAPVVPPAAQPAPGSAPKMTLQEFLALQNQIKVPKGLVPNEPAPKAAPKAPTETVSDAPIETTAKAEKAKAKLDDANKPVREHAKADAKKGWIEIEGKKWEIPDTAKDPVAWAAGLRSNQQKIIGSFKRAEKLNISEDAKQVLRDHLDDMRESRYRSDAEKVKESILSKLTSEDDIKQIAYHFGEPFFATWSKAKRD